jgi:hypothetical protein
MRILLYLAIGLAVGGVSGMLGIGGGMLLVPALVWLCGFDFRRAAGTTLAILVPPIGLPAAYRAFQEHRVDLEAAGCVAVAFACGAYAGTAVVRYVPDTWLRIAFGSLMIYIAVRFILTTSPAAASAAAGLVSVGLAWLGVLGLRVLGRRHLPHPDLGSRIRTMQHRGHGDTDYQI